MEVERSGTEDQDLGELRSDINILKANANITERESVALSCIKYCLFKGVGISGNYRGSLSLHIESVTNPYQLIVGSLNIVFEALESTDKSAIFELHERIYQHFSSPTPVFIPNYQEDNENDDDDDPIPF
ncbi:MAG: hypothetical protein WCP10_03910 [Desulfuromonadales bacterium]